MSAADNKGSPKARSHNAGYDYDIIVVGLGVFGLATCYELARRGHRVLGFEQYDLLHDHGSSHGSTRVIRKAYFEHPNYVPLLHRAYDGWKRWEDEGDQQLLNLCGVITAGPKGDPLIDGVALSNATHQLGCETLTVAQANERFPAFSFPENENLEIHFEPGGGYIYADRALELLVNLGRNAGATLLDCRYVSEWNDDGQSVLVRTDEDEYKCRSLVLTTGPWAKQALAKLGVELTLMRKLLFWFMSADPAITQPGKMPVFLFQTPEGLYYGLPETQDTPEEGVRVCRHDESASIREIAEMNTGEEMRVARFIAEQEKLVRPSVESIARKYLAPALIGSSQSDLVLCDTSICQYTLSPDHHFIIDHHPESLRVAIACGFSGHGFKFAPAIADILADLAEGKPLPAEANFLRLSRFGKRVS